MYGVYRKERDGADVRFTLSQPVSLLGYKSGIICKLLSSQLRKNAVPERNDVPMWRLNIEPALGDDGMRDSTIVIDAKPKGKWVSLYEVTNIWGFSAHGWTPMLLRMCDLITDQPASDWRETKSDFTIRALDRRDIVYTFLYAGGSIENWKLTGDWVPPKPSSTNHVFLWPEVLAYFDKCIHGADPGIVGARA